ncbi:acyltransferase family protein [Fischerella sp. NIES-3754]|uniref:acyltransferase family protein n=1 Tax=Fischerella sp. NIES-3754 TaxID=1752063 RepID=UPI000720B8D9|nr:acyltransferase [Fischerella sp. NIES-3754]BAU04145.1 acyltransferase [Fischerella sp. NIES-3754]BCX06568.1 MAG: acyltransferase [Fischerella sp.]
MEKSINYSYLPQIIQNQNRLDVLLALRGFACLMVVIIHCAPPRNALIYQKYDFSWILFSHGAVAVWIFFCLSGYLMGKAFFTERYSSDVTGVINFWRNRVIRIFPLYYFAILILSIFVYPDVLKFENWGYLLRICTFTFNPYIASQSVAFNDVFWSLSTEVQFYIIIPFIYNLSKSLVFHQKYVIATAILIILIVFFSKTLSWLSFLHQINNQMEYAFKYWYTPIFNNIDIFLCGFLVNALIKYQKPTSHNIESRFYYKLFWNKKYLSIILMILLYLFTAHHLYHQELWGLTNRPGGWRTITTIFIFQPLTAVITSFFIFAFESDNYYISSKNEKLSFASVLKNPLRILELFGNLSYGVYIWHMPILGKIYSIFTSNIPLEAFHHRLVATLFLSVILATVTYYLVELPATKWKNYHSSSN